MLIRYEKSSTVCFAVLLFYFRQDFDIAGRDLDFIESLAEVGYQVVYMFCTDRKTDGTRSNVLFSQFLFVQLRVCSAGRMDDERFNVSYIGKQ